MKWFGSKGKEKKTIFGFMAGWPHDTYVEPFGGGASVLVAKEPVALEVYNDLDEGLYHFFTVLSDPRMFAKFYRRVQPLLYSRKLWTEYRDSWECDDPIDRAVRWFVVTRMSFRGIFGAGWDYLKKPGSSRGWMSIIDLLPEIHKRMASVQIENLDFQTAISRYDSPKALFYLDPPYVHERRSGCFYAHEMGNEDHDLLVEMLLGISGAAILSGYKTRLYDPLIDAGWHYSERKANCCIRRGPNGCERTESLWISPALSDNGLRQRSMDFG